MIKLPIGPTEDGSRLDRLLRKRLPLLGLSTIYGLIRKGSVRIDGKKIKQDHRLKEGETLYVDVDESEFEDESRPDAALSRLTQTDFFKRNFIILHEDQHILVCNKPAGIVVHPGSGHKRNDTLIDLATAYILSTSKHHVSHPNTNIADDSPAPVLMHRLDRDTSGVILIAKNAGIVRLLHEEMRAGKFAKRYVALCHNRPPEFEGTVTARMRRGGGARNGMKMGIAQDGDGAESSTSYKILEYQNDMSRLEILLHTGKTHQIRVHMAHLKAPVLGDERYGDSAADRAFFAASTLPRRLYLHAHKLSFPHPKTGRQMTITAPVPKEFGFCH